LSIGIAEAGEASIVAPHTAAAAIAVLKTMGLLLLISTYANNTKPWMEFRLPEGEKHKFLKT